MGHPKRTWKPKHRALVRRMVKADASQRQIAKALGCAVKTVVRHFSEELAARSGPAHSGREAAEVTEEQRALVGAVTSYGIPHDEIAKLLGCGVDSLRARFPEELATGATRANAAVAGSLYRQALAGNVRAAMFWIRCRMGWRENEVSPEDPDLPPDEAALRQGLGGLDPEGRAAMRKVLTQLGAQSRLTAEGPGPSDKVN